MKYYKLTKEKEVVECDLHEMGRQYENNEERIVSQNQVGNFWVSTVFLGMDHNFKEDGPPLVFETIVFPYEDGKVAFNEKYMERCCTWQEAVAQHIKICSLVALGIVPS
jgi:hypothetical protein